ncbi:MAG: SpoIID/LytB domain-containing protein [Brevinema sp.]
MRNWKIIFNLLFLLLVSCRYAVKSNQQHAYLETRILLSSAKEFIVSPQSSYIIALGDKYLLREGDLNFQLSVEGIMLNNVATKLFTIDLEGVQSFFFNGKAYKGSFTVHHKGSELYLINKINLEDYLLSVIPAEVYTSWSLETLKTQAIASRTYALYEIKRVRSKFPKQEFDLYSDTRSQVYAGISTENKKTTKAIQDTVGQVLTYKGDLIKSYFSASVGDMSAKGSEIGHEEEYLQPRSLKLSNMTHPYVSWSTNLSSDQLTKYFRLKGKLIDIKVVSRTSSGRIDKLELVTTTSTKIVFGNDFRKQLGYQFMKSTYADIFVLGDSVMIQGQGFGHGVGLGQWEAQELAKRGVSYPKILTYFYKNTELSYLY